MSLRWKAIFLATILLTGLVLALAINEENHRRLSKVNREIAVLENMGPEKYYEQAMKKLMEQRRLHESNIIR